MIKSDSKEREHTLDPVSAAQLARGKDVFISYAREDRDFVERLHKALKEQNRHAWVDWEGIPPSTDWMKEIFSAINEAQAFVFVASSSSMASEICKKEFDHAIIQKKRIIPLKIENCEISQNLTKIQWLPFAVEDDFIQSVDGGIPSQSTQA